MAKRPANLTSYSELSTLAHCEMQWHLRYREKIRGEQTPAQVLGTLMHTLTSAFWEGAPWRQMLAMIIADTNGGDPELVRPELVTEEPYALAYWLMERYERHYRDLEVEVCASELDLRAKIPGTKQVHQAIIDQIWSMPDGTMWMVERKTYKRRDMLNLIPVLPQLTLNLWVARENGYPVTGIVFDGIYTQRWKLEKPTLAELERDLSHNEYPTGKMRRERAKELQAAHPGVERPDSESFDLEWLDRTDEHVASAIEDVRAGVRRREALRRGSKPMRNISTFCRGCSAQSVCFSRLAFPLEFNIEIEED